MRYYYETYTENNLKRFKLILPIFSLVIALFVISPRKAFAIPSELIGNSLIIPVEYQELSTLNNSIIKVSTESIDGADMLKLVNTSSIPVEIIYRIGNSNWLNVMIYPSQVLYLDFSGQTYRITVKDPKAPSIPKK